MNSVVDFWRYNPRQVLIVYRHINAAFIEFLSMIHLILRSKFLPNVAYLKGLTFPYIREEKTAMCLYSDDKRKTDIFQLKTKTHHLEVYARA